MVEPIAMGVSRDALGGIEQVTYTWPAGSHRARIEAPTLIYLCDGVYPRVGDRLIIGPCRVRVVETNFMMRSVVVVRDGPLWVAWLAASRAGQLADLVYRRLIITAAVWELANYDQGRVPSWRDLHAVRWLKGWGRWTR